ncbi:MAG: hypothetical protein JXP34_15615 [Planctomycetes bacterium]|nr:hypothetical protein [Planctomycetota bacterium]
MGRCARIRGAGAALVILLASPPVRADVIITEILASNTAYPIAFDTPDLVEIHNRGPDDVVLGGTGPGTRLYLTDDPCGGDSRRWWTFPSVTILEAGEYLTVACDASGRLGLHANFKLGGAAGAIALVEADAGGRRIIDLVEYPLQYENVSYARFENADGTHAWHYTSRPTFLFGGAPVCATETLLAASPHFCGPPADLCPPSPENILEETFIPDIDSLDYSPALVKATDDVVVTARVGPSPARVAVDLHYVLARQSRNLSSGESAPSGTAVSVSSLGMGGRAPLMPCRVRKPGSIGTVTDLITPPTIPPCRGEARSRHAFRLHSTSTQDAQMSVWKTLIPSGGTAGDEVIVAMRDDGQGVDAPRACEDPIPRANDTWWVATIPAQPAGTTVRFWATSYRRGPRPDPDPCAARAPCGYSLYTVENADPRPVRVNEALAINATGIVNPPGDREDWVEIFNRGDEEVDLAGLYLTTSPRNPTQWAFPLDRPDLTRIPARGYVIVWFDALPDAPGIPGLHASGILSGTQDRVYLANAKGVFDGIDWNQDPRRPCPCDLRRDEQDPDISIGRIPDGADFTARIDPPSPGAPNPRPSLPPVIRSLRAASDDPSCEIPCENPYFVVAGDHLANPARVLVDDFDVTASVVTLPGGDLSVPASPLRGVASTSVRVHQDALGAQVVAKVRFRCAATAFVRGDATGDGRIDLADPIRILGFLFGAAAPECEDTADVDDDGRLLLNDPVHLLAYLFSSGALPGPPFFCCGADPTPGDGISCETYVCR